LNVEIPDNDSAPVTIQQGGNSYFKIVTTNSSESVQIGNSTTKPNVLLGDGNVGIGTTSPDLKLDVSHGTGSEYVATFQNTADNLELKIGTVSGLLNIQGANASNNAAYQISLNAEGGSVGINNSSASSFDSEANNLVVGDGVGDNGITIFTGSNVGNHGSIFFGDATSTPKQGQIRYEQNNEVMSFFTNTSEKMRLDLSGRLLVGTTTEGSIDADELTLSGSGRVGMTIRSTDNNSSRIYFSDATSGGGEYTGYIVYEHSNNHMRFGTAEGERLRIDHLGNFTFTVNTNVTLKITTDSTNPTATSPHILLRDSAGTYEKNFRNNSGASSHYKFYNPNGEVGQITTSGSATAYNTSSDYRLKENVDYTWDATTRLKQLKPARFNFIADADTTVDGFLAHEVSSVVPEAITGAKDAVDADGNPEYQGIDQSKLVPLLIKTIQELEARITALEA